jgi:hypothetical protein
MIEEKKEDKKLPPKKLPHQILLEQCKKIGGDSIWALGVGQDEKGKMLWEVFCSNKKMVKNLPKEFLGNEVSVIYAPRPA